MKRNTSSHSLSFYTIITLFIFTGVLFCANSPLKVFSDAIKRGKNIHAKEMGEALKTDLKSVAQETGVIRVTVTIYKDQRKHDEDLWQDMVSKAAESLQEIEENTDEGIIKLTELFNNAYAKSSDESGIHGNITINIESGKCRDDICGIGCECISRYKGACLCTDNCKEQCCGGSKANK